MVRSGVARATDTAARRIAISIAIGVAAWIAVAVIDVRHGFHPHPPRLDLLSGSPAVLKLHVGAAVLALLIGLALLVGVKGRAFHRIAGWAWVACMMTVALSSFWIRGLGHLTPIHFLSGWVALGVPLAVVAVKRRDLGRHRFMMIETFTGALIVAGAFTFTPERLLWRVFIG